MCTFRLAYIFYYYTGKRIRPRIDDKGNIIVKEFSNYIKKPIKTEKDFINFAQDVAAGNGHVSAIYRHWIKDAFRCTGPLK